ncbi:MAG: DUF1775 domain-containing protein [Gemmatimonadetes bacterium]|nr:DUF1775 domain-containing protein [Gemmatimonadota bacterium]
MLTLTLALLQVAVTPTTIAPAELERVAVRVVNPADSPIVAVRVEVPEALAMLGVDAPPGWSARRVAATESSAPAIEWTGGRLASGEFREFAFFVRLGADARRVPLVFPVRIRRADGTVREWRSGGDAPAPEIQIRGTVGVTPGGAFVLAAGALGLAALAVALALRRGPISKRG